MTNGRGLLHLLVFALFASACGGSPTTSDAGVETPDIGGMEDAGHCDELDRDGDGVDSLACGGTDCDDHDEHRLPGNAEVCDQLDNDCDARLDEGLDLQTCWPPCALGTLQTSPPTVDSPPTCSVCEPGTYCAGGLAPREPCVTGYWDHDADAATVCIARVSCEAGQFVSNGGDATHQRMCSPCAEGSYSTMANAAFCATWATCYASEYVDLTPTSSSNRVCENCPAEHFSLTLNAVTCSAWRDCPAGTRSSTPSSSADRLCTSCAPGTFTANPNTASCSTHTVCNAGQVETAVPSASANRVCTPFASAMTWTRQFGTLGGDEVSAVATLGSDTIYVAGFTQGAFPDQPAAGGYHNAYVRRYDANGDIVWTRQFGPTNEYQEAHAVVVDSGGHVVVAGWIGGAYFGTDSSRPADAFIRKYDADGAVLWTREFGTSQDEFVHAITTDHEDNIIVTGMTRGSFPPFVLSGQGDGFVAKYDPNGNLLWLHQFGTESWGFTGVRAVTTDASGNVFFGGDVATALPGQTGLGYDDAFLRKCDADGNVVWTRQFGTNMSDAMEALSIDSEGHIIVAGNTNGTFPGQPGSASTDLFLRAYDTDGGVLWTRQFGTEANDFSPQLGIRSDGELYLSAFVYYGAVPGHTSSGDVDVFVTRHSADGVLLGARQFGSTEYDEVKGIALLGDDPIIAGRTHGTLPGQSSLGSGDAFVIRMPAW